MDVNPYSVRTLVLRSGERLPVLIERTSGEPLFEPTVYSLSELRATNKASNTIDQTLRSIMHLHLFLHARNIELDERLRQNTILSLNELDDLVRYCKQRIVEQLSTDHFPSQARSPRRAKSESIRLVQSQTIAAGVKGHTAANRIRVIRD
ncbi:hypothetical protein [Silvimonas amylolytica]|uniref:hypothetical protein n=1 Tax=Silvimonas amylolytica TaxID=449663 RepID=UPI00166D8410|nr:hypothetical protein [Silvimonas amylolytica]